MSGRFLLLVSFLFSVSANAGVWGERGIAQRFLLEGNVLYAADGRGVAVYDVTNAAQIQRIDVESADDETTDIALVGSTDLVAATRAGIDRYSVAADGTLTRLATFERPTPVTHIAAGTRYVAASSEEELWFLERSGVSLTQVRRVTPSGRVRALAMVGDYVYAGVEGGGVVVYEPPSSSVVKELPATANAFALSGTTLWAASLTKGLTAIDVRSPGAPRVAGNEGSATLKLAGVAADGTKVYAFETPSTIRVFDGSDIDDPKPAGVIDFPVDVIAAGGDRLFVSGPNIDKEGLRYESGKAVVAFEDGQQLPNAVVDREGPVSGVWTDGSVAYVIDPPYFRVLDVSKTDAPRELTSLLLPNTQERVRVNDGIAVVYGRNVVHILDVHDRIAPRYLGTWDIQGHPVSNAAVGVNTTFVEANEHSGLHIVDYTDPQHAVQVGGRKWHYHDMAAGADAIYVLEHDLFFTFEIADRTKILDRQVEHIRYRQLDIAPPNSDYPSHIVLRGLNDVRVYSLEDRYAPKLRATLPLAGTSLIATGDDTAWIALDGTLRRIPLANPTAITDTDLRVSAPQQISVAGEKIVVADRYRVRVYGPDTESPVPPEPPLVPRRRGVRH